MTLSTAAVYPVRVQTRFWSIPAFLPALGIATATALVILWQHSHVAVFWDLAYLLDTAARIAGGAMPYRDFPLAHAPVPFLIQAAILHLFGPGIRYAQLYTALAGAVGTLLTWAILRQKQKSGNSHIQAFLLTLPLIALGLYCVFPFPSYDCDCALAVLLALWLWQCMEIHPTRTRGFLAGAALVLPLFCKQNIGLPFLAAALFLLSAMLLLQKTNNRLAPLIPTQALWSTLLGAASALAAALLTLQFTCGLSNYLHWTLRFAMQRRMVGASTMLTIFHEPTLLWMLPCVAAGILLLRFCPHQRWRQIAAFLLLAAPLFCPVAALFLYSDAEARSDALLAIWPLLLLLSIVLALFRLRSGLSPRSALPRHAALPTDLGFHLCPLAIFSAAHGGTAHSPEDSARGRSPAPRPRSHHSPGPAGLRRFLRGQ